MIAASNLSFSSSASDRTAFQTFSPFLLSSFLVSLILGREGCSSTSRRINKTLDEFEISHEYVRVIFNENNLRTETIE